MAKQCPFWLLIIATSKNESIPWTKLTPDFASLGVADCKVGNCQMWDRTRNDCGLKQSSPSQEQNNIPEKDRNEQMENQPDFHPIDRTQLPFDQE